MDGRPLPARLRDLDRVKAWPLLTYAILTGQLVIDLDLLLVKDLGDFGHATERLNADDYRAGREIAARLGWSRRWTYDVLHECLPLLLAWTGRSMRSLAGEDLDRFEAELQASVVVSVSSRRAYRARLFGLRQLLFEARDHRHPADSPADRSQLRRPAQRGGPRDRPGDAALPRRPFGGAATLDTVWPVRRVDGVR